MKHLYIIWGVNPSIFPGLEIPRWYGVLWVLGLWLSYHVVQYIYKVERRTPEAFNHLAMYVLAGTFLGARLGHILFYNPLHYWYHPIEILPIRLEPEFQFVGLAGLASHGGAMGILIAIYLYCRRQRERYLWMTDRLVIAAALAGCFIRLGNLMNSEMIGIPTSVPWAFVFMRVDNVPRHPTQLYEAITCMILFMVCFRMWYNKKRTIVTEGRVTGIFLIVLFSLRFIGEFLKTNQEAFEDQLLLNMGQALSIPFILAGIFLLLRPAGENNTVCS